MLTPRQAEFLNEHLHSDHLEGSLNFRSELQVEKYKNRQHPDVEAVHETAKHVGFEVRRVPDGLQLFLDGVHVMTAETHETPSRIHVERFVVHALTPKNQRARAIKIAELIGLHFGDKLCRPYPETLKEAAEESLKK